uniref:Late embryogenesis abundant protein LEA-2 subgroup domain-containing protein n=1 Tax=Picea sitchensis TaxID=3332 RepID=B8LL00_PICSI|nr:unknown [Picea sitchensis]ACN40754.1 unknown [Picea sitchensis]
MQGKGGSKDCGNHGSPRLLPGRGFRRCMGSLFVLVVIALFVILVVYLVLHPHKPRFYVQDATVHQLNLTNGLLTSSLQFSIVSHNPNDRIGVYYDSLNAYATYAGEQITPQCSLTPFYQGDNDVDVLSPILYGNSVALAPFVADHLNYEKQNGVLSLTLKMYGRIRWKVGSWTSGRYHLNVNCFAIMGMRNSGNAGQVPLQPGTRCDVEV